MREKTRKIDILTSYVAKKKSSIANISQFILNMKWIHSPHVSSIQSTNKNKSNVTIQPNQSLIWPIVLISGETRTNYKLCDWLSDSSTVCASHFFFSLTTMSFFCYKPLHMCVFLHKLQFPTEKKTYKYINWTPSLANLIQCFVIRSRCSIQYFPPPNVYSLKFCIFRIGCIVFTDFSPLSKAP